MTSEQRITQALARLKLALLVLAAATREANEASAALIAAQAMEIGRRQ